MLHVCKVYCPSLRGPPCQSSKAKLNDIITSGTTERTSSWPKKDKTNHLKTSLCYSSFPHAISGHEYPRWPCQACYWEQPSFLGWVYEDIDFSMSLFFQNLEAQRFPKSQFSIQVNHVEFIKWRLLSSVIVRCLIPQPVHRYTQCLTRKSFLHLFTIMSSTNCKGNLENHPFCLPENEQKNTIQKGKELQQYYTIASIHNITITLQVNVILNSWCQDHSPAVCLCTSAR